MAPGAGRVALIAVGAIALIFLVDLCCWFLIKDLQSFQFMLARAEHGGTLPTATRRPASSLSLYEAARRNELEAVAALLEDGTDPNQLDKIGPMGLIYAESPLYAAAWKGHRDVVKVLLDAGANPNLGSTSMCGVLSRTSPLHGAARREAYDPDDAEHKKAPSSSWTNTIFGSAGAKPPQSMIEALLAAGADPNMGSDALFGVAGAETPLDVALRRSARAGRSDESAAVRTLRKASDRASGGEREEL